MRQAARCLFQVLAPLAVSLGACLGMAGAWGQQMSLSQLEQAARDQAVAVRAAREDVAIAQYRREGIQAQDGGRLSTSLGVASTREPVTDDVVRQYDRASVQVGARWPLLGGPEQAQRALTAVEGDLAVARARLNQAQSDAVVQVRLAYVDALRAAQRLTLGQAFMSLAESSERMLGGRARDGLLLDADRQAFQSMFETARRDAVREQVAYDEAVARLRSVAGLDVGAKTGVQPGAPPRWDSACLRNIRMDDAVPERAAEQASAQLKASESMAEKQRWVGVDAGVSVTQSLSRDLGSASGRSTGVGVDLVLPFEWRRLRAAAQAEAQARVRRAELDLELARQSDTALARQVLAEWQVRQADRQAYEQRLAAAVEALRVARLRAGRLDGDVLERLLQARYAMYGAALEASQSLQRLERAQAQMLALWPACEDSGGQPARVAMLDEVPAWLAEGGDAGKVVPGHDKGTMGLSWFVWNAAPWLATPEERLVKLPLGTERLLLSLNGQQLREAATPPGATALRQLLDACHRRGLRVALLLGEPTWALDEGRARLVSLMAPLSAQAFDGLNLDLERDQLSRKPSRRVWREGVVRTVQALSKAVPWPLALTTHDRDLNSASFMRRLALAGVKEFVPMIYATSPKTAARRLRDVQQTLVRAMASNTASVQTARPPAIVLAQSVEQQLPATESWHAANRQGALEALMAQADILAREGLPFTGLAVQSFEAFEALPP